jgi:hypothetical protein
VQQFDTEGPTVVVDRVSTRLGDLACSPETVRNLVDALHDGTAVQLTANTNGQTQTATFNPNGVRLGYGEAYITLAMAAEELRDAGITGCATPDEWQAVLLGGSVNTTVATSSGPIQFPGIVTLHSQGQGWGQIAQTTHVQLSQIVNNTGPSPTGYSSAQMNQGRPADVNSSNSADQGEKKGRRKYFLFGPREPKPANNSEETAPSNSSSAPNSSPNATTPPATNPPPNSR